MKTLLVWNKKSDEVFTSPVEDKSDQFVFWTVDRPCIVVNPNFRLHPLVKKDQIAQDVMIQGEIKG